MKKIIIILVTFFSFAFTQKAMSQAQVGISFNTFYDELSPYGQWIDYPQYGRIWVYNRAGFRPYYDDGHWEFTSYGWAWVSDMPWGWAPFHYGRWAHIPAYGWAWVPGYEWAPAWVGWCQNNSYYGWAPLSPGLGVNISFGSIPRNDWIFVQHQYINNRRVRNYYVNPASNVNVYNNVTVINNTQVNNNITYVSGPQRTDVERYTNRKIEPKPVAFASAPGKTVVKKKLISIYRPEVNNNGAVKPANNVPAQNNTNNIVPAGNRTMPQKKQPSINTEQNNNPVPPQQQVRIKPQKPAQVVQPQVQQPTRVAQIQAQRQQQLQNEQKLQEQNRVRQEQLQKAQIQQQLQIEQQRVIQRQQQEQQQKMQQQNQIRQQQVQMKQNPQQVTMPKQRPATVERQQNNFPQRNNPQAPRRK